MSRFFALWAIFLTVFCSLAVCGVRVRSTLDDLSFVLLRDQVCMYSKGKESNEGAMMHYHVMNGDDDFDVYIRDPDNHTVYVSYAGEHGSEDRVYFTKHLKGEYSYCIDNHPYSGSKKVIKMIVGITSLQRWKERIDPLTKLMHKTDSYMLGMHDDQILHRLREQNLRSKVEESNTLVLVRGVTETVVIVVVSLLHVILIKHLFARRSARPVA